ncbi:MAG: phenylalanine--tRNA ligase subunit alpha [Candidatus Cloacimonetes bacterium 4572_55]|nr:MAG: phenylalanine--tRNA ligase subunit alpha [Candidatus Cloacimonetes bacterium 4572_55]
MKNKIKSLKEEAFSDLNRVDQLSQLKELDRLRIKYMGRKGAIQSIMKGLKSVDPKDRPLIGRLVNSFKSEFGAKYEEKREELRQRAEQERLGKEWIDVTLPGVRQRSGKIHIIQQTLDEISSIFKGLGFSVADGPEIESDYYNFDALNIPKDHPARDMWDTFYIDDQTDRTVLRTHTSPVQIRTMERRQPPVRIIVPGRVYRNEAIDASHHAVFYQVEGLYVDNNVTFRDLKGVLSYFSRQMFGDNLLVRFRPSFFPFTEPSAEVDISCVMCSGKGCAVCKYTGWVEILGCGMVDPAVYRYVNYDPEIYSGYAFGLGVERIAMLRYQINDIRLFLDNDVRFLEQF